jgi:hypothetical protein
VSAVCLRCRRPLPVEEEQGGVALTLDGAPMLAAVRDLDRSKLDEHQLEVVEALEAGLCPMCGRAR